MAGVRSWKGATLVDSRTASDRPGLDQVAGLTKYVAGFVCDTQAKDLPDTVVALGKKSILDGLGLAHRVRRAAFAEIGATGGLIASAILHSTSTPRWYASMTDRPSAPSASPIANAAGRAGAVGCVRSP